MLSISRCGNVGRALRLSTPLDALRIPPGNRRHRPVDELAGFHAIRVNDQYRIIFRFEGENAVDVRCADYP